VQLLVERQVCTAASIVAKGAATFSKKLAKSAAAGCGEFDAAAECVLYEPQLIGQEKVKKRCQEPFISPTNHATITPWADRIEPLPEATSITFSTAPMRG
jgi:hypothetical protein